MRLSNLAVMTLALLVGACTPGATTTPTTKPPIVTTPTTPATTPTTAVVEVPPGAGPLLVWVGSEALAEAVIAQADAYTAATGVAVVVITVSSVPDDDRGFLDTLLEPDDTVPAPGSEEPPAGLDRAPDVFIGPHIWLTELAEAGLAEPVDLPDGLPAAAVAAVTLRGFTIAVPVALDTVVQFRNPDLMPEAPGDLSDLQCPADLACLLMPGDGDPDVHYPFLVAVGGYLFGEDAEFGFAADDVGVDSSEAIASAAILQGLLEGGGIATAVDREDARARFASGEAALIWDGAGAIGDLDSAVIEPLPTISLNPPISVVRVTAAWVNPSGSLKTEAAEFALQYLGGVDGSTAIARALGLIPVWPDDATQTERRFIEAAATGHPVPYITEAVVAWEALAEAFGRIHGGTSAGTALVDAADTIRFQP
jgi:arabinogalactan oligomer/maltooligosaccharide transport system substrate-binding protein